MIFRIARSLTLILIEDGDDDRDGNTDGITPGTGGGGISMGWITVENSTFGTDGINTIVYANNKFVAGGDSGKMAYSTNGKTWTAVTNNIIFGTSKYNSILAIAYGDGKFVVGGRNNKIAYSTNGTTWTEVITSTFDTSYNITAITYGNGKFVAGSDGYYSVKKITTSTDGVIWTNVTTNAFDYLWYNGNTDTEMADIKAIAYGNNKFVAGGECMNNNVIIGTSTDGTTWTGTVVPKGILNVTIYSIAYGNNKFVAVGISAIATSSDGTSWTSVTQSVFDANILAITYGNGKFVAVGVDGKIAYLFDE